MNINVIIPAYNEEGNIASLLKDLITQDLGKFVLNNIIVVSDGSDDGTVSWAKKIKSEKIKVYAHTQRRGKNFRINQYKSSVAKGGIMVVMDADIRLPDKHFLVKLVTPITEGTDLTSSNIAFLAPKKFFEKVVAVGTGIVVNTLRKINKGDNVYTCRGVARAFSNKLALQIVFPISAGDDAFSYFYCKTYKYKYEFVDSAVAVIKLPDNINDHLKQSKRFAESKEIMGKYFREEMVAGEYRIPLKLFLTSVRKQLFTRPIYTFIYLSLNIYVLIAGLFQKKNQDISGTWDASVSSKNLKEVI